jgi:glycosyltransferase involved in cell wall biosynthesis
MISGHRVVVVMPAYNAGQTLERTFREIPRRIVDEVLLTDDGSSDETLQIARRLGIRCFRHSRNFGYGRNQKTCYLEALKTGADIVVMLHPDYQYPPQAIPGMVAMVAEGAYDVVLASRLLDSRPCPHGMPFYKYTANRCLTLVQNFLMGLRLSEYHTGYRVFSRRVLETLPLQENSDGFLFDNEFLVQAIHFGFAVGEVPCSARYFPEASSISFFQSIHYGLGVLLTTLKFLLQKAGWMNFRIFTGRL